MMTIKGFDSPESSFLALYRHIVILVRNTGLM